MIGKAVVVEPSARLRELVTVLLEETGYDVAESSSLEEAVQQMDERGADKISLIFADVPPRDAEKSARTIARNWPWVRMIVPCPASERSVPLPKTALRMQTPWNALDVLIQAERANSH